VERVVAAALRAQSCYPTIRFLSPPPAVAAVAVVAALLGRAAEPVARVETIPVALELPVREATPVPAVPGAVGHCRPEVAVPEVRLAPMVVVAAVVAAASI
jgi:hypothetical protein